AQEVLARPERPQARRTGEGRRGSRIGRALFAANIERKRADYGPSRTGAPESTKPFTEAEVRLRPESDPMRSMQDGSGAGRPYRPWSPPRREVGFCHGPR